VRQRTPFVGWGKTFTFTDAVSHIEMTCSPSERARSASEGRVWARAHVGRDQYPPFRPTIIPINCSGTRILTCSTALGVSRFDDTLNGEREPGVPGVPAAGASPPPSAPRSGVPSRDEPPDVDGDAGDE